MSWYSFMTNVQYLAQVGHFTGGAWIVFLVGLFFGHTAMLVALATMVLATAAKEFWFDIRYEKDSWGDSLMDWSFWQFGELSALGVFYLGDHLGVICELHSAL